MVVIRDEDDLVCEGGTIRALVERNASQVGEKASTDVPGKVGKGKTLRAYVCSSFRRPSSVLAIQAMAVSDSTCNVGSCEPDWMTAVGAKRSR